MSDNDNVICPNCVHEFVAVPVNVQAKLAQLEEEYGRAWQGESVNETTDFSEAWGSAVALRSAIAAGYVKPGREERATLSLAAEIDRLRAALHEISNSDMTTRGFQMLASAALEPVSGQRSS